MDPRKDSALAFADPQTVTIDAVPHSLKRVGFGENTGAFSTNDSLVKLGLAHQYGRRTRRTARLDHSKIAPDPLISSQNIRYSMSTYIVTDVPVTGYTVAEAKLVVDGFLAFLNASSGAAITSLLGGEV